MKKYFEETLPDNYEAAKTVDASNKKTGIIMNLCALAVMAVGVLISFLVIKPRDFFGNYDLIEMAVVCAVLLVYIVLHELVHGIAYKLLTKRKLKFGISLTAAYCGVPDIYVYRRCALISLFAPLVVFTAVFAAGVFLLSDAWHKFYCAVILFAHLGGCVGDIYDIILYLTVFRDPETLMRDTGPKQTFYVRRK